MHEHILLNIVFLLGIAVLVVAAFRRLHFPPILGYIIVGMIVGPYGLSLIEKEENISLLAEFGIVFLLFAIGLEFSINQVIAMRKLVFGLGTAQVALTAAVVYAIGSLAGLDTNTNIVISGAFALSSTAIVIKQLTEQSEIHSRHGRSTVGILIFQDIMAIPLLILIPALALSMTDGSENALATTLGIAFLKGVLVVGIMHLIGRYLLKPLFHEVALAKSQELFTLTVLTVALGAAAFTEQMGLSMTLGAFLAGMMLSETEYRHQIESDIRPFQDIFLGLFFVTVGMLISIDILIEHFWIVILITLGIFVVKGAILYGISRLFGKPQGVSTRIALSLSQVGEFTLVIMTLAFTYNLLPEEEGNILLTAAVLSMSIAPFLIKFNGKLANILHPTSYKANQKAIEHSIEEETQHISHHVILCGFGRVGQIVGRLLHFSNQRFIALDMDISRVNEAHAAGENVYYGDASKQSILHAAVIERAKVLIITFDDLHATIKILKAIRQINKKIPILVRTIDDTNLNELTEAGATEIIPDTFESSIMLASHLLIMLGHPPRRVLRLTRSIRKDRYQMLENFYPGEDNNPYQKHQIMKHIIHTIPLDETDFIVGKRIKDIELEALNISIKAIKRGQVRGESPSEETLIKVNDSIVITGLPENVKKAEFFFKTGK